MTPELFVKSRYPKAKLETNQTHRGDTFQIKTNHKFLSEGRTESEAWQRAKERIINEENDDSN